MNTIDIVIRVIMAVVLGGLIGYEREIRRRPAGFRTHILVCLGAAIVPMVQLQLVDNNLQMLSAHPELSNLLKLDSGRMVAQVIGGIGFLGAGTIIVHKGAIKGLTTASSLWVVACIGIAVGFGYYEIALIGGAVTFLVVMLFKNFELRIYERRHSATVFITYYENAKQDSIKKILGYIKSEHVSIKDMTFTDERATEGEVTDDKNGAEVRMVTLKLYHSNLKKWQVVFEDLRKNDFIISIDID